MHQNAREVDATGGGSSTECSGQSTSALALCLPGWCRQEVKEAATDVPQVDEDDDKLQDAQCRQDCIQIILQYMQYMKPAVAK